MTGTDRRQSPRRRLLRRAQVVFRNGYSVLDCIVLDLSEGGARLKLTNWNVLPNRFELRMENSPPQIATVCHRAADVTGIRFLLDGGE
ncbi:MAG: PilZ domain-containing protein [Amaricoccus sp.]